MAPPQPVAGSCTSRKREGLGSGVGLPNRPQGLAGSSDTGGRQALLFLIVGFE
jgi:hypothetical protein